MQIAPDGTRFDLSGPEDGPVVVLIHGLGLNRTVWRWMAPVLASAGFRVVAHDIWGHGESPAPDIPPDLALLSRQIRGLLDHLGYPRASLVGFSLGGMIARRFAQDFPARTEALVILHSPHRRSAEAQAAIWARVEQARHKGPAATVEAALDRWFTPDFRAQNPKVMDLVRGWVLSNDPAVYPSFYAILADGIDEIVAPTPPIACPALVMTGDQDFGNGPEMTMAIAAEIKGSATLVLPGLRHMALAENPDAVNAPVLAFLNGVYGRGAAQ